jgi:hypothetical protein
MMHASIAESINLFRTPVQQLQPSLTNVAARASMDVEVSAQAAAIAYSNNFRLMMYAALLLAPLVLFLRDRPPKPMRPTGCSGMPFDPVRTFVLA